MRRALLAVSAVVVLLAAAGGPAMARAAGPAVTRAAGPAMLKLSASAAAVVVSHTFQVTGRLTAGLGDPIGGQTVKLVLRTPDMATGADGEGKELGEFVTGADGTFTTTVTAENQGELTLTGTSLGDTLSSDSVFVWSLPAGPPAEAGQLKGAQPTASGNRRTTVSGAGFAPDSAVALVVYSTPQLLAVLTSDGEGAISGEVTIPQALKGEHTIVAVGYEPGGRSVRTLEMVVNLKAGDLPVTGASTLVLLAAGVLLLVAGIAAVLLGRRRHNKLIE